MKQIHVHVPNFFLKSCFLIEPPIFEFFGFRWKFGGSRSGYSNPQTYPDERMESIGNPMVFNGYLIRDWKQNYPVSTELGGEYHT
jgi:hypothetical protein